MATQCDLLRLYWVTVQKYGSESGGEVPVDLSVVIRLKNNLYL